MASATPPPSCIDFAFLEQDSLFLFGWLADRDATLQRVLLQGTDGVVDLSTNVFRFPRPDVASAWSHAGDVRAQEYGVGLAAQLKAPLPEDAQLSFSFVLSDGTSSEVQATVSADEDRFAEFVAGQADRLERLLASFDRGQAKRLRAVAGLPDPEQAEASLGFPAPQIDLACFLTGTTLLVIGRSLEPEIEAIGVRMRANGTLLRFRRADLRQPAGPESAEGSCFVGLVTLEARPAPEEELILYLSGKSTLWPKSLGVAGAMASGLGALERHLQLSDPNTQLVILEEVARATPHWQITAADAMRLGTLWRTAAARLPAIVDHADLGLRLVVDLVHAVGGEGVFLAGWALLDREVVRSVAFRVPEMPEVEIWRDWITHQRPDVWQALKREGAHLAGDELGFTCFVDQPIPRSQKTGYLVVHCRNGLSLRMKLDLPSAPQDVVEALKPILTSFNAGHRDLRRLLDRHIGPAVQAVWSGRKRQGGEPAVTEFGTPPADPDVSLVIPLYGRFDFIELQMTQFVDDPFVRDSDIIYVVDDPAIYDDVRLACLEISGFFDVPFRLVYGRCNGGFAAATNLGASLARGRYILMMNSDVMPKRAGWLEELVAAHRALPEPGAVGPKLIYEDGTVQHAGMRFMRMPAWGGLWVNDHPHKGQPNRAASEPVEFLALTGACLLLRASLWRELGGLSEDYIIGDFEDSDLCLRILETGRRNWLVPAVELYHLERQSQDRIGSAEWRRNLSLYNCWMHTRRWDEAITRRVEVS